MVGWDGRGGEGVFYVEYSMGWVQDGGLVLKRAGDR